jgi:hypothetical protein
MPRSDRNIPTIAPSSVCGPPGASTPGGVSPSLPFRAHFSFRGLYGMSRCGYPNLSTQHVRRLQRQRRLEAAESTFPTVSRAKQSRSDTGHLFPTPVGIHIENPRPTPLKTGVLPVRGAKSRGQPFLGDAKLETAMSRRKLFPLAIVSALVVGTAAFAQDGGGGGGGGGAGGGSSGGASGGSATGGNTGGSAQGNSGAKGNSGRTARAPMLVVIIRTPIPGLDRISVLFSQPSTDSPCAMAVLPASKTVA